MSLTVSAGNVTLAGMGTPGVLRGMDVENYKWVALVATLMMFHVIITGFTAGGGQRSKAFSEEFMEKNFKEEHEKAFPEGSAQQKRLPKGGYPDVGSGRYSEKLAYKDWFLFNVGQRIHYHYLESVTSVVLWLLIAGLKHPWVAVAFGGAYIVGRIVFHIGYSIKGPKGRMAGFIMSMIAATVLFAFSLVSPIQMAVENASSNDVATSPIL